MDKLVTYRDFILKIIDEYSQYKPSYGDVSMEKIIDPVRDHYQLMFIGWHNEQRIHGCIMHINIRNDKIWIQHDGTEAGVANLLVEMGVPKTDIVLAYQSPFKRRYTEFAVG